MTLQARTAVVTGGTEGIGLATVRALATAGARVCFCARTASRVSAVESRLRTEGLDVSGAECDVTDPESVMHFASWVRDTRGDPDILVNNAGIGRFASLASMSLDDWDAVMDTNVRSLFLVTREFLPAMQTAGSGDIVVVASLAGRNGFPGGTAYGASKHAALGFAKSLLLEVRKHGVRVFAICPGSVDTPFFDKQDAVQPDRDRILQAHDVASTILAGLGLPRNATVSELDIRPANP